MSSQKLLALVRWVGGEDDKKYTAGVPVEWIKSFDHDGFLAGNDSDNTFVIEWHTSTKEPLGGWVCYDAFVITVSDRLSALKRQLSVIDGLVSPRKVWSSSEPMDDLSNKENSDNLSISRPSNAQNQGMNKKAKETMAKSSTQKTPAKSINGPSLKQRKLQMDDLSPRESLDGEMSGIAKLDESVMMQRMVEENRKMGQQLQKVCKELKHQRKHRSSTRDNRSESSSDSSSDEPQVRIGPKKSKIYVTESQWRCAKAKSTFTAMGLSLLSALFPVETLLQSNLKGGYPKIPADRRTAPFKALDKKILEAIYYTVETFHQRTFNRAALGISINNKLNSLRKAHRKRPNQSVLGASNSQDTE